MTKFIRACLCFDGGLGCSSVSIRTHQPAAAKRTRGPCNPDGVVPAEVVARAVHPCAARWHRSGRLEREDVGAVAEMDEGV